LRRDGGSTFQANRAAGPPGANVPRCGFVTPIGTASIFTTGAVANWRSMAASLAVHIRAHCVAADDAAGDAGAA
jgi:hypothetical protein